MRESRASRAARQVRWITAAAAAISAACAVRRAPAGLTEPPCYGSAPVAVEEPSVEWVLRQETSERSALDAFCWGVGPVVFTAPPADSERVRADSFAVVVWNTHVGNGDLSALITDLRSGALTGEAVRDFVLLLQEAHRGGDSVPWQVPDWVAAGRRQSNPLEPGRIDVSAVAERQGLSLFYAPSMRSGTDDGLPGEDRGNAILSTFPLQSPVAIELPWERQRRVAVTAAIEGRTTTGEPWGLRLVSAHLDNRSRMSEILRSFGPARERQASALAEHLADSIPTVLGADLNAWLHGSQAAEVRVLREQLPLPAVLPPTPTVRLPGPLPDRQLDYLLFRLPAGWAGDYRVLDADYGSDHQPLLGWVRFAPSQHATPAR